MASVPLLELAVAACGFATELGVKTAEFLVIWNSAFWLQEGKNRSGRGGMDPGPHSRVGNLPGGLTRGPLCHKQTVNHNGPGAVPATLDGAGGEAGDKRIVTNVAMFSPV